MGNKRDLIKLSATDADVLATMRLALDTPLRKVATLLKTRDHTIRTALGRMRDRGIISPFWLINLSKLGFTEYDVSCGLAIQGDSARSSFFEFVRRSPQVSQLLELAGSYSCSFTVCARSPLEVDEYMQKLGDTFGAVLLNETIGTCLRYTIFPPKYLSQSNKFLRSEVTVSTEQVDQKIDEADRRLLSLMARRPEMSFSEMARTLEEPASTVSYRRDILVKRGVVLGQLALIEPSHFGHQSFRIHLAVRGLTTELKSNFARFARIHPNVTYLIEWLGDWHYCLGVVAPHVGIASLLMNHLYDTFGSCIADSALIPVLKDHKMEFYPFVE